MRDFITTWHCLSRAHCNACRNDPAWRAVMAKTFVMPDECPYPETRDSGRPATVSLPPGAMEKCLACPERNCPNAHVCCGGSRVVNVIVECPSGAWKFPAKEVGQ